MAHVLASELRNAVLQHAVSGQLTARDESDTNVYDTCEEIKNHIRDLISKKEIKKRKPSVLINEDELPFEIPDEWIWVRLIDICSKIVDGDHNPPAGISEKTDYMMFSAININNGTIVEIDKCRYLSKDVFETENERTRLEKDDLLFTIVGTLGRSCVYKGGYNACFQRSVAVIRTLINPLYLKIMLDSPYIQQFMVLNATGTAQKGFYLNQVNELLIALPPIEEQARIVARVDELMAEIDEYEKIENQLIELKKNFPGDMKAAVLQAAFSGKLTSFLNGDSDIDTALKELSEIKSDLVKKKLIKKEQPLEPLKEEEIPYDIPENWRWMKIGDVIDCGSGSTPLKGHPEYYINGIIPWLKTGELTNTYITACEEKITKEAFEKGSFRVNKPGDILIAMYGATIGKLGICTFETTTNQACLGCTPFSILDNMYLFYYFKAAKDVLVGKAEGGAQPNISRIKVRNHPIPLPPIEEQKRIVEKLDQLLPLCEEMEKEIA